jgi:hypothetical protein
MNYNYNYLLLFIYEKINSIMGIGDWGLGIGDWGLGPNPHPPSPIPNPQSPTIFITSIISFKINLIYIKF